MHRRSPSGPGPIRRPYPTGQPTGGAWSGHFTVSTRGLPCGVSRMIGIGLPTGLLPVWLPAGSYDAMAWTNCFGVISLLKTFCRSVSIVADVAGGSAWSHDWVKVGASSTKP